MNNQKTVWIGLESSGKSVMMFRRMVEIIDRNAKYVQKGGTKPRIVATNSRPTQKLLEYASEKGIEVRYVHDLDDIVKLRGADIFIDELSVYFDARKYADLPLYVRRWVSQAAKVGVHIYGTTQNWQQVDISFRRLTDTVIKCKKIMGSSRPHPTIPSNGKSWALFGISSYENKIDDSTGETKLKSDGFLTGYGITRLNKRDKYFFDTNAEIEEGSPPPLRKITRTCPEDGHKITKYI